ncbi:MAG TPA: sulfite exporter TauE/SafE family protein [Acidimicrobiales bacterium]|nr:sulfite exporter TauE/SafE family protein [Acidimicrobiales bacterium]
MSGLDPVWLVLAGFGGGLAGSVAGLASLVSYPALLAVGLPPVSANVSNTVALVFSSTGSILGSGPELRGQRARAKRLAVSSLLGGAAGGVLLLATPPGSFALVVPWLIGIASLGVLVRRRPSIGGRTESHEHGWALPVGVFLVGIYGGYFGAAAGVLLLGILLFSTGEPLARSNAMKNLLAGVANGIAAIAFAAFGPVRWMAVLPLAAGFLVGGRLGPSIVRRAPATALRVVIACAGLGLAAHLGITAYR